MSALDSDIEVYDSEAEDSSSEPMTNTRKMEIRRIIEDRLEAKRLKEEFDIDDWD